MVLGITGKIGAGKGTAAAFFKQRQWIVLDADTMAHELYRPYKRVWKELVDHFGETILKKDDVIDRQKLKQFVFGSDPESKKNLQTLNDIIHPELKRVLKDDLYFLVRKHKNVILTATLWQELGLFELCDKVLLIKAGDALTYERVHKRDGMTFDLFENVSSHQTEPPNPDFIIVNEKDFQTFYKELNLILNSL